MKPLCLLAAGALAVLTGGAAGQNAVAEGRRDVVTQTATSALAVPGPAARETAETSTGKRSALGVGSEFGEQEIVYRRAHVEPWSVSSDTQYFYTDNAALSSLSKQADWYLRTGVSISYTNRVRGPFFVDLSLQQYFFRYNRFDALDFDLTRFQAGGLVQVPVLADAFFFGRYRLERITESGFGSTYLTNHIAELGLQKTWKISRGQQISAALEADLPIDTDPRPSARREYSLTLGYTLRLTEQLSATLSYRGSWYDYAHLARRDWNHIVSLDATYDLASWLRLGATISYSTNDSNLDRGDYDNLLIGGDLSLRITF